jgi:AraC-like DNA-binding protein
MSEACQLKICAARPPGPFSTTVLDEATKYFATLYSGQASIDYHREKQHFRFDHFPVAFGETRLTRWLWSNLSLARPADHSELCIGVLVDGFMSGQIGSHRFEAYGPTIGYVVKPDEDFSCKVGSARGLTLGASIDILLLRAEFLTGMDYGESLLDDAIEAIDLRAPIAAILTKTMKTALVETANLNSVGMGGLAAAGYEDLLLNLLVPVVFPKVAADLGHAPVDCGASVISRVRDHLRAHAGEVIEMGLVASRFGISMRAMQENFRRYYGFSPRDYLMECRLDRAHQDLLAAHGDKSILNIAMECGFPDYKHFSAKYRDRYGELPSETMRTATR